MKLNKESTPFWFIGGKRKWNVVASPLTDMTTPNVDDLDVYDKAHSKGAKPAVRQTYTDRHTGERKEIYVRIGN